MRVLLIPAMLLLNLCGTSGGKVGDAPAPPHQGPGWSMRLPPVGAKVTTTADRISVDAVDYSRWYDVRWAPAFADLAPPAEALAATECDPVVWDTPVSTPDAWTAGGLCTRGNRFQWLIARVERHGDRALLFFYVANQDFLAFEDAWVDFAATAATLTGGDTPPQAPDPRALRRTLRDAATRVGPSLSPLPGGRVLSTAVIPELTALWDLRRATAPLPPTFNGSAPPSPPAPADTDTPDTDTP